MKFNLGAVIIKTAVVFFRKRIVQLDGCYSKEIMYGLVLCMIPIAILAAIVSFISTILKGCLRNALYCQSDDKGESTFIPNRLLVSNWIDVK